MTPDPGGHELFYSMATTPWLHALLRMSFLGHSRYRELGTLNIIVGSDSTALNPQQVEYCMRGRIGQQLLIVA